ALEGNVAHGHRGAPVASGWANEFARQKSGDRRTRLDNSNRQRRVNQSASAQPWRAAVQFRAPRFGREEGKDHSPPPDATERDHSSDWPDRLRQIDFALLLSQQH